MTCIDCRYRLLHDGNVICTYEEGECVKLTRLEKEKAVLEEQCAILDDCNTCTSVCKTENIEMKIQLNRAKKLLEDLIRFQPYIDRETIFLSIGNEWKTAIYKAEQFLKEVRNGWRT